MSTSNSNIAILPNPLTCETKFYSSRSPKMPSGTLALAAAGYGNTSNAAAHLKPVFQNDDYDENGNRPNGQLSTSSPAGIAAASAVTPDKLANLLLTQGPLAIRHLTSHLASLIPGFAQLSLSKQRRLIIAALDSGDPVTGCVFEKVGWGQWAAKKVGSEFVKAKQAEINRAQSGAAAAAGGSSSGSSGSYHGDDYEHYNVSVSSAAAAAAAAHAAHAPVPRKSSNKSHSPPVRKPSESFGWKNRRESITNPSNDPHADVLPRSPRLSFRRGSSDVHRPTKLAHSINDEGAILSSSDEENDSEEEGEEHGLNNKFQYHEIKPMVPGTIQPRSHSQVVYSSSSLSTSNPPFIRHPRSSFNSGKGISKPKTSRSRMGSFNSSSVAAVNSPLTAAGFEPVDSLSEDLEKYKRRQSFNESFIRKSSASPKRMSISNITNATNSPSLLLPSSPAPVHPDASVDSTKHSDSSIQHKHSSSNVPSIHSDTDEEDWALMGAASLRHDSSSLSRPLVSDNEVKKRKNLNFREEAAAYALVNLSSV